MNYTMQCHKPLWCFKQGCPCARCDDVITAQKIVFVAQKWAGFSWANEACVFAVVSPCTVANMTNMIISSN